MDIPIYSHSVARKNGCYYSGHAPYFCFGLALSRYVQNCPDGYAICQRKWLGCSRSVVGGRFWSNHNPLHLTESPAPCLEKSPVARLQLRCPAGFERLAAGSSPIACQMFAPRVSGGFYVSGVDFVGVFACRSLQQFQYVWLAGKLTKHVFPCLDFRHVEKMCKLWDAKEQISTKVKFRSGNKRMGPAENEWTRYKIAPKFSAHLNPPESQQKSSKITGWMMKTAPQQWKEISHLTPFPRIPRIPRIPRPGLSLATQQVDQRHIFGVRLHDDPPSRAGAQGLQAPGARVQLGRRIARQPWGNMSQSCGQLVNRNGQWLKSQGLCFFPHPTP